MDKLNRSKKANLQRQTGRANGKVVWRLNSRMVWQKGGRGEKLVGKRTGDEIERHKYLTE